MSKTRLNSRQKRAAKANIARLKAALALNPSQLTTQGTMRASTTGAKSRIIDETYYGFAKGLKHAAIKPRPATVQGTPLGVHEGKLTKTGTARFAVTGSEEAPLSHNPTLAGPSKPVNHYDTQRINSAKRYRNGRPSKAAD